MDNGEQKTRNGVRELRTEKRGMEKRKDEGSGMENREWKTEKRKRRMGNGQRGTENGENGNAESGMQNGQGRKGKLTNGGMENGERRMKNGEWGLDNGQWRMNGTVHVFFLLVKGAKFQTIFR